MNRLPRQERDRLESNPVNSFDKETFNCRHPCSERLQGDRLADLQSDENYSPPGEKGYLRGPDRCARAIFDSIMSEILVLCKQLTSSRKWEQGGAWKPLLSAIFQHYCKLWKVPARYSVSEQGDDPKRPSPTWISWESGRSLPEEYVLNAWNGFNAELFRLPWSTLQHVKAVSWTVWYQGQGVLFTLKKAQLDHARFSILINFADLFMHFII